MKGYSGKKTRKSEEQRKANALLNYEKRTCNCGRDLFTKKCKKDPGVCWKCRGWYSRKRINKCSTSVAVSQNDIAKNV